MFSLQGPETLGGIDYELVQGRAAETIITGGEMLGSRLGVKHSLNTPSIIDPPGSPHKRQQFNLRWKNLCVCSGNH